MQTNVRVECAGCGLRVECAGCGSRSEHFNPRVYKLNRSKISQVEYCTDLEGFFEN